MASVYDYELEFFEDLPNGKLKEKGIRRAIDAALERNDYENALDLYRLFAHETVFYDDSYEGMLILPEYTALFEKHPELWEAYSYDLIWAYKWFVDAYHEFYQISLSQIEAMLKKYDNLCNRFAYNKKTYYCSICNILLDVDPKGRINGLSFDDCRSEMLKCGRDGLSDCRACETNSEARYALFYDDDLKKAERIASPLFLRRISCAEVPHITFANFALYHLKKGNFMQAEKFAEMSWRLINKDYGTSSSLARSKGYIMLSYAYTSPRKGMTVFKKTFAYCCDMKNAVCSWHYYYGVYHLMQQLEKIGIKMMALNFPDKSVRFYNEHNKYYTSDLKDYSYEKLKNLSSNLDKRNGNSMYSDDLKRVFKSSDEEE